MTLYVKLGRADRTADPLEFVVSCRTSSMLMGISILAVSNSKECFRLVEEFDDKIDFFSD